MKVNTVNSSRTQIISDGEALSKPEKGSSPFAADLSKSQDAISTEKLNALLEQITEQGKRLGEIPTYPELKKYRELIRSFLGEVVGRAYILQSDMGWDRQGRQKMYSTIKEIDHQLAALAEDVRHGQEHQLNIMNRLDVIRGMLVDLYS